MNAARWVAGAAAVVLGRETSYIGVLIDDLVTRGVDEPYRLFTSRSEFRLTVRQDNALRRLSGIGAELGLYSDEESRLVERRLGEEDSTLRLARETSLTPVQANRVLDAAGSAPVTQSSRVADLARRQNVELAALFRAGDLSPAVTNESMISVELELKYSGYFDRERVQAEKLRRMAHFQLPADLSYEGMRSLSIEARQKLAARRPATLAQAASIPGVSPSDLQNLMIEVERRRRLLSESAAGL
jgi:tRNA uridine 5-carboxymethylaminomethyl modification enzyme